MKTLTGCGAIVLLINCVSLQSASSAADGQAVTPVTVENSSTEPVPVNVVKNSQRITHLGVQVQEIASLTSNCMPPNDELEKQFLYSGGTQHFNIPPGYSFVVTDVLLFPSCANTARSDAIFSVTLKEPGTREASERFNFRVRGTEAMRHFPLAGGMAFSSGSTPQPTGLSRNPSYLEIQLLGYFVKGRALNSGESHFP